MSIAVKDVPFTSLVTCYGYIDGMWEKMEFIYKSDMAMLLNNKKSKASYKRFVTDAMQKKYQRTPKLVTIFVESDYSYNWKPYTAMTRGKEA